jgi:hypothetical protein
MTMPDAPPEMPVATPTRRNLVPLLVAALAVAVVAVIVLVVVMLTSGDDSDGDAGGGGGSFEMTGTFSLTDGATGYTEQGDCEGYRGYDDISEGTLVTVYSSSGDVLATGRLGRSSYQGAVCEFEITVANVPGGHDFYQVEVSHRGKIAVPSDEARAGEVALTLG